MIRVLILGITCFLMAADWPQWRGPNADGISPETGFVTTWDGAKGKNVRWKKPLPGAGNSSPVMRGNDLVLTATTGRDHAEIMILCFDATTGAQRWRSEFMATPADAPFSMFPPERGHAASTPVITTDRIITLFGTGDFVCVDRAGKPLWMRSLTKDYGILRNDYGMAASPIVADGLVIVQMDHLEGSYLLAVDLHTGITKWKTPRTKIFDNWATPVVTSVRGTKQVIALGTKTITGYDLATGKAEWTLDGLERLCSCTPILRGEKLSATSGPAGATLAIDLCSTPTPSILWRSKKVGPFVPSGIAIGDHFYFSDDQGTL
ncbi:MAG: PQQ-binding-like beta-propeller repeat protein, partial [Gemmataceae bacterium]